MVSAVMSEFGLGKTQITHRSAQGRQSVLEALWSCMPIAEAAKW